MTFNGSTLPNPTGLSSNSMYTLLRQRAYGGVKPFSFQVRNDLDAPVDGQMHGLEVQWSGLTPAQLATLRTAWQAAAAGYVTFAMTGMNIDFGGVLANTVEVMATADNPLVSELVQGWDENGDGPELYDVSAMFVSRPY